MKNKSLEKFFLSQKFLSKIPFLLFVIILFFPIGLLRTNYRIGLFFIAFYISYWAIKAFESYYYILVSYLHLLSVNQKDYKKTRIIKEDAKNLKFAIVLPYISTPYDVIEDSIISVLNNDFPYMKNITVILAPEERDVETTENVYKIYEKYKDSEANIVVIPHAIQPGDGKVKGANITYAIKEFTRLYSPDEENTLIITTDGDAKVEKNIFTFLAYHFLVTEMPHNAIYQFTPVYSNNWIKSTFFARLIAIGTTFWQLAESQNPEFYRCFSTYAMSLKCLRKSDYWSRTSIVEDGFQYWRSYFAWDGVFRIVNVPAVVKMDVVEEENLYKTIKSQYKQLRRWSWGCSDIEYVIPEFYHNKKIKLIEKIRKITYLVVNHLFWSGGALTLFFIGYLPGVIDNLKNSIITLTIPLSVSLVFTLIFATIAFPSFLSILIMKKYTKFRKRDYLINIFQWLLIPTLTLTLFSIPAIESQLRYFFNWRIDVFEATKKMKRN
ncbi:MAG: glycosyltransferase family 2 protein [Candidatus Gracilibacteria bacterium]|nr:glycosyltransferase family 2 protein [Candidatus Gracilibacteria bacterium]